MSIRMIGKVGAMLLLPAVLAGCALGGAGDGPVSANTGRGNAVVRDGDCKAEPSMCRYEPGEREYAEQEAARLNRESARKLRRWF